MAEFCVYFVTSRGGRPTADVVCIAFVLSPRWPRRAPADLKNSARRQSPQPAMHEDVAAIPNRGLQTILASLAADAYGGVHLHRRRSPR